MIPDPDQVLNELQRMDGVLWLHILGQQHWEYNELPFWVLLKDESQFNKAVNFLQDKLRELSDTSEAKLTVSFSVYRGDNDLSMGYFEEDEFFTLKPNEDNASVVARPRTVSVFDIEYPNEPWAISPTEH